MTYLSNRDVNKMSGEEKRKRLQELKRELMELSAQRAMGGSQSNFGDFKATRRSIARLITHIGQESGN